MILIVSEKFVRFITGKRAQAITLFPFVFVSKRQTESFIINHEKIHLRQQLELLILPFYILYLLEFLFHYIKLKNYDLAYRSISFEKEAYANDKNFDYLKTRRFFQSFKYMSK